MIDFQQFTVLTLFKSKLIYGDNLAIATEGSLTAQIRMATIKLPAQAKSLFQVLHYSFLLSIRLFVPILLI